MSDVFIEDVTGKLYTFFERIAEIPECRRITTSRRFHDEQIDVIDVQIIFEIQDKPLMCRLRDKPDVFLERSETILDSLWQNIEEWRYVGPPYEVIETDEEYKAFFTPEQEKRKAEMFG